MLASSAYHLGLTQNIPFAYMVMVLATLEAGAGILIFSTINKFTNKTIPDEVEL
jgi:hypothetical protein